MESTSRVCITTVDDKPTARNSYSIVKQRLANCNDFWSSARLCTPDLNGYMPPRWRPLEKTDGFRLMCLAGGSWDEPLSCRLLEVTFDMCEGRYLGLSYTWGSAILNRTISCNDNAVRITDNLYSALRRLRQPQNALFIWCDGICINQGNDLGSLEERAKQIPLMDRIFSSASRVIVDLGDDDGTLPQAVEGINRILRIPAALRTHCQYESDPLKFLSLPDWTDPMWPALNAFMSRPWFKRIWCVQEVILAREIRVMFGLHFATFEQLVAVAIVHSVVSRPAALKHQEITWDLSQWAGINMTATNLIATSMNRKKRIAAGDPYSIGLCDLTISTLAQHSTDPRDRVYALYGLAGPQVATDLPVSYSEPVSQLSRRYSEYLVRNGNGVWMLVHSVGIGTDLPSWTIDLTKPGARQKYDPLAATQRADGESKTYAAGTGPAPELQVDDTKGCIEVRGFIADNIISTSGPCPIPINALSGLAGDFKITTHLFMSQIRWILSVAEWAEQLSDTPLPEALWRTLIVNWNPHAGDAQRDPAYHALPGFGECFDELLVWSRGIVDADQPIGPDALKDKALERYHMPPKAIKYWTAVMGTALGRRAAHTHSGALALVPMTSLPTDVIAVFHGFPVPFVLRKARDGYNVVGICYVHGIMNGEVLQKQLPTEDIVLW